MEFITDGMFYNPEMRLNRTISSLCVGALDERLRIVDGFCASGVRGVRYAKENKNVEFVWFVDADTRAKPVVEKNAREIAHDVIINDFNAALFQTEPNFVEVDPFGTPAPFMFPAAYRLKKHGYLSITATDVMVLCSNAMREACFKRYGAYPLNTYFTHEIGIRILLKKLIEFIAPIDLVVEPLIALSHNHYLKIIVEVEKNARRATKQMHEIQEVGFCHRCGWYGVGKGRCPLCDGEVMSGGPVYTGPINNPSHLKKMIELNKERNYVDKQKVERLLTAMELDSEFLFLDTHFLAKTYRCKIPKKEKVIALLHDAGFSAHQTHFSPTGIKTNASFDKVRELLIHE